MAAVRLGANRGRQTVQSPTKVRTGAPAEDAARVELERDVGAATNSPLLGGVFVDCVTPDVGEQLEVHHRLGRKPQGWVVTRRRGGSFDMYEAEPSDYPAGTDPKLTLVLERGAYASVDVPFTLYIF